MTLEEYCKKLEQRVQQLESGHCKHIITLFGTMSSEIRREEMTKLQAVPDGVPLVLIATGKYVGEGFDYPRLDTLFLALPISWKGKVAQYAGRLHRNYPGKKEVQIYDYVDIHVPMLENMYQKRLRGYASIGYKIKSIETLQAAPDLIYDGKSFYPMYQEDIRNAAHEILIVGPLYAKKTHCPNPSDLGGGNFESSKNHRCHAPTGEFS